MVTAGQILINGQGNYRFDIESGTFSFFLVNLPNVPAKNLQSLSDQILGSYFGQSGVYDKNLKFERDKQMAVSEETLKIICQSSAFVRLNAHLCN